MKAKSPAERFVTFFLAEFDQDGRGQYISAGHTTGYVYRRARDTVEELPSNNMLVGALDFPSFQCSPIGLENGDVLISYSDGLTEAENDSGEPFGEQRVLASLRVAAGSGAAALLEHVVRDVEGFIAGRVQTDDITIMTIGRVK
jgi:sigma-B regulation protein RsbU (phosphoserine phosphatase)